MGHKVNKNGKFKREKVKENHRGKKGKKIGEKKKDKEDINEEEKLCRRQ